MVFHFVLFSLIRTFVPMFSKKESETLLERIRTGGQMTRKDKLNLIVQLSIPSILAQLTSVVMFFIDQAMVGRISVEAAAACGLVESSTWLIGSLTNAASMGFSVQVAHFIGANDMERARHVFRHGLLCTLLFGFVVGATGLAITPFLPYWLGGGADIAGDASIYFGVFCCIIPFFQLSGLAGAMLKCSGDMRTPSIMSIVMCVMDVVFNFILIFVFHLGVLGVALGTALAIVIGGAMQAYIALFRNKLLALFGRLNNDPQRSLRHYFEWGYVRNAVKISAPMALQSVLMGGAQIVSTIIVAPLGNIAIAANTFAITAESVCYMPGVGIGEAATTLIGQSIGAARRDLCRSFARLTVGSGIAVMALMGAVMFLTAPLLMALMTPVEEIIALGASVLRIEAFAEPMFAAAIVSYSICVGAGDTLRPAIMNLCSMWGIRLTLAALLAPHYGLRGVWVAMAVELTFRGGIFLVRIFRERWMKGT